jgi:hypothetical protein
MSEGYSLFPVPYLLLATRYLLLATFLPSP